MKHLRSCLVACAACLCMATARAQGVRPEVGKPLQQAGELLKAGKARDALAKVREADAVAGKTPAEQYDRRLPDPMQTVFNTNKVAEEMFDVATKQIPASLLARCHLRPTPTPSATILLGISLRVGWWTSESRGYCGTPSRWT